jgi:hypothetical protein
MVPTAKLLLMSLICYKSWLFVHVTKELLPQNSDNVSYKNQKEAASMSKKGPMGVPWDSRETQKK